MSNGPSYGATALNQFSFKLRGERWNETDWKTPEFQMDMQQNNPRFVVFCNNPTEIEKTRKTRYGEKALSSFPITCRMKWKDLWKFFFLFKNAIENSVPVKYTMDFKGPKFDDKGEKVKGEFVVTARLTFGQNADGMIFMQFAEQGREKPMFIFKENFWVPIKQDDQEMNASEASKLDAYGFLKSIEEVVGAIAVRYYIPEAGREMKEEKKDKPKDQQVADIDVVDEGW
ncbi:hypothetical protein SM033_00217 [Vibrio phage vB_VpaM_sm033]|nr:hypothetical protein SM033_00217 [Vibrio phage vB_VpaM_sm033]